MKKCLTYSGFLGLIFVALLATGTSGCYYDKEELLYPGAFTCDSAVAKYSTSVLPIISANCYSCHAGSFPSAGIKLDTYNDLRANIAKVYGAVSHSNGFIPMPQGLPMLSNCNIQAIKSWKDAGAPNN